MAAVVLSGGGGSSRFVAVSQIAFHNHSIGTQPTDERLRSAARMIKRENSIVSKVAPPIRLISVLIRERHFKCSFKSSSERWVPTAP